MNVAFRENFPVNLLPGNDPFVPLLAMYRSAARFMNDCPELGSGQGTLNVHKWVLGDTRMNGVATNEIFSCQ